VPGPTQGRSGYLVNWHVPIDDTSHWKYQIIFKRGAELDQAAIWKVQVGDSGIRRDGWVDGRLPDGRFPQDRAAMQAGYFAGLGTGFAFHDLVMCEAQGAIADRSKWHLGAADKSIIALKRVLQQALQKLDDPGAMQALQDEKVCAEMAVVAAVVGEHEQLGDVLRRYIAEARARLESRARRTSG
jgi:phthalate 4,5-dioxygenase